MICIRRNCPTRELFIAKSSPAPGSEPNRPPLEKNSSRCEKTTRDRREDRSLLGAGRRRSARPRRVGARARPDARFLDVVVQDGVRDCGVRFAVGRLSTNGGGARARNDAFAAGLVEGIHMLRFCARGAHDKLVYVVEGVDV